MITIKGSRTTNFEVEVCDSTILEAAISILKKLYGLQNVDYIKDGRMYESVEYATSHSWTDQEDRGTPTEKQIKALNVIDGLTRSRYGPNI